MASASIKCKTVFWPHLVSFSAYGAASSFREVFHFCVPTQPALCWAHGTHWITCSGTSRQNNGPLSFFICKSFNVLKIIFCFSNLTKGRGSISRGRPTETLLSKQSLLRRVRRKWTASYIYFKLYNKARRENCQTGLQVKESDSVNDQVYPRLKKGNCCFTVPFVIKKICVYFEH